MFRLLMISLFSLVLAACTVAQIGERYDKSIDDDLNKFQIASTTFITSMVQNAGTPAGSYGSAEAKTYYAASAASLSNMALRASLLSSRECPSNVLAQSISVPIKPELADALTNQTTRPMVSGNCVTVMLAAVQSAFATLEAGHRESGKINRFAAAISSKAIDNSVFIALTGLRAKDY